MADGVNELTHKMNSGEWFKEKAEDYLQALAAVALAGSFNVPPANLVRLARLLNTVGKASLAGLFSSMYDEGYQAALDHHNIDSSIEFDTEGQDAQEEDQKEPEQAPSSGKATRV
jgi:hypothetical protein